MGNERENLLILAQIGEVLAGELSLEKALKKTLPKILQLVGMDSAGVYLLKDEGVTMELLYTVGVSRRFASDMAKARIDCGILGRVFKTGKPVALHRISPQYSFASTIKRERLHAIAYIPIRASGRPSGIFCLSSHKPYSFKKPVFRLFSALGRQIGSACERIRVTSQAEHRRSQLENLSRLSLEFGSASAATDLFRRAARKAKALLLADWAGISVLEGENLYLAAQAGSRFNRKSSLGKGKCLVGRVIQLRRPLVIKDIKNVSFQLREQEPVPLRRGYKAFLGVPLELRGHIMGVLSVRRREVGKFSAEEVWLLQGIAEQVGIAFHKLKLLEEKELVHQILSGVHNLDLQALLDRLTQKIVDFFKVDMATIGVLGENKRRTVQSLARPPGVGMKIRSETLPIVAGTKQEWILKQKKPLLIPDLQRDKKFVRDSFAKDLGMRSFGGVPLVGKDQKALGVLTVVTLLPRRFRPDEIRVLQELASAASIAIDGAMLVDTISKALQTKVDFLNTFSHDIRTPVDVIIGHINLILEGYFGPITAELNARIQLLKRNAEDLLAMLNQTLSLSRLEAGKVSLDIETFKLKELVSELGTNISILAHAKGLEFQWGVEAQCLVRADGHKVKEVLHNLLTNAIKYTEKGRVSFRAGIESSGDRIWFEVADTGQGIPETELTDIFEPFHQVAAPSSSRWQGVGLGLVIVKRLLDRLGGSIEVTSTVNEGSVFKVILPRVFEDQAP
ncbi:MAG: GAF domain-containing protein [Candidatus Binatia bacterium]